MAAATVASAGCEDDAFLWPIEGRTPHVWLRWPYVAVCSGSVLTVFEHSTGPEADAPLMSNRFTMKLEQAAGGVSAGRGANVLHGIDVRDGYLAASTANGLVLLGELAGAPLDGAPWDQSALAELAGHTKAVGFMRIHGEAGSLYTSSFDRTVRQWSLASRSCLQTVKVGTPALQLALVPGPASTADKLLVGCGDGSIRVWDTGARKASKALLMLSRFSHDEYVGKLQLSGDGERLLSCSRNGQLQLWRRDEKAGYVPDSAELLALLPPEAWLLELTPQGVLEMTARGGVRLWDWQLHTRACGAQEPKRSAMLESPSESACIASGPEGCTVVVAGVRTQDAAGSAPATGDKLELQVLRLRGTFGAAANAAPPAATLGQGKQPSDGTWDAAAPPAPAPSAIAPAVPASGSWERWRSLAVEEGVLIDAGLEDRLAKMEAVASAAGRDLNEVTVRAFLRKMAIKEAPTLE